MKRAARTDAAALHFSVLGTPAAKGNMRNNRHGGMYDAGKGVKPWTAAVAWAAKAAMAETGAGPFAGAVEVEITFRLRRPKKPKARLPITNPDLDKLLRATYDALTQAGVWGDDSQVCRGAQEKVYAVPTGASVTVREMA